MNSMKRNGFTFVELMIAVAIGAFITVTAAAAMRGIVSGRQTCQDMAELSDEVRYASGLVRNDLNNIYRNDDFRKAKFELSYLDDWVQSLTFYTVSRTKARPMQPEGDVYEVQYFVKYDPDTEKSVLLRRYCPVVPGVVEADDVRAKGILAPIAESISAMQIRCYNGTEWTDEWNEERGRFPELIEVAFRVAGKEGKKTLTRTLFMNIPRLNDGQDGKQGSEQGDSQQQAEDYESYMSDDFSETPVEGGTE